MVDSDVKRFWISVGIFWGGIHFVGLGIYLNGENGPWNPTWVILSSIFWFELIVLEIFISCAIARGLWLLAVSIYKAVNEHETGSEDINNSVANHKTESTQIEKVLSAVSIAELQSQESVVVQSSKVEAAGTVESKPEPPKLAPSPDVLKQKAIEQIIRGY